MPQLQQLQGHHVEAYQLQTELPRSLYRKDVVRTIPHDMPPEVTLVSGHCPQDEPLLLPQRWVVDTSGGQEDRPLTAVRWPDGKVWQSKLH